MSKALDVTITETYSVLLNLKKHKSTMLSTLLGKVKPILISKRSTVYGGGREREGGGGGVRGEG